MSSPLPSFLHLFNLFAVHFEPFPWKTWHNTIYFYLNRYSGHVWNVHYSCIIHGHYWRSVCKSALLGTPEAAAESRVLINCIVSFPKKQACSAFWGKMTVSWNCREQSCLWKRSCGHFICHLMHILLPARRMPQPGLIRVVLKPYSDPDFGQQPGKSHGRVVGIYI